MSNIQLMDGMCLILNVLFQRILLPWTAICLCGLICSINCSAFSNEFNSKGISVEPVAQKPSDGSAGLFIGINDFEDEGISDLKYAVNDAVAQAYAFVVELKLIPARNCVLALSGEPTDIGAIEEGELSPKEMLAELEKAQCQVVKAELIVILDQLSKLPNLAEKKSDILVVSISSHGFEDDQVPYFLVSDSRKAFISRSGIAITEIESHLNKSSVDKSILIVDACRENPEKGTRSISDTSKDTALFTKFLNDTVGKVVLASCAEGQVSFEDSKLGHGVFTYFFLEAISGEARTSDDGLITIGTVSEYVSDSVYDWVRFNRQEIEARNRQRPWMKGVESARQIPLAMVRRPLTSLNKIPTETIAPATSVKTTYVTNIVTETNLVERIITNIIPQINKVNKVVFKTNVVENVVTKTNVVENFVTKTNVIENIVTKTNFVEFSSWKAVAEVNRDKKIPGLDMDLVWINSGEFQMGPPKQKLRVGITYGFWIGKHEVTQAQWREIMGNNPSQWDKQGDNKPVERVTWQEANEFCQRLSSREKAAGRLPDGYAYRLPTEAQWEYACRAGATTNFPFGNLGNILGEYAWTINNSTTGGFFSAKPQTHEVGGKNPNAWGIYDMLGNVSEWCEDWHYDYPKGPVIDPTGPKSGRQKVLRGGSYALGSSHCNPDTRFPFSPNIKDGSTGFRVTLRRNY